VIDRCSVLGKGIRAGYVKIQNTSNYGEVELVTVDGEVVGIDIFEVHLQIYINGIKNLEYYCG
jgi:hypothetical protein